MTNSYHSQFGEDRILSRIFHGVVDGTCVEVGANDGCQDSNSLWFERIGWKCILVEPNAELCRQIRSFRKAELFECAASSRSGTATLSIAEGADRAHGVSTISSDQRILEQIRAHGFTTREVTVNARTLSDILAESGAKERFEFLTVDVEGHEIEVLQGLDFSRWRPRVIVVEDNSFFKDREVANLLLQEGYVPFKRTGVNDWYASPDDSQLAGRWNRAQYALILLLSRISRSRPLLPLRLVRRTLLRLIG